MYPFSIGGAERRVYEVARRLTADGHDVTVFTRQFWDGPVVTEHDGITLWGVCDRRPLYVNGRRSIFEAVEFGAQLLQPLADSLSTFDVIDVSVFPYFPLLAASAVQWQSGTRIVGTWHEVWGEYWTEYLPYGGTLGRAVELACANVTHKPVAVSRQTRRQLSGLGVSSSSISVVPNGIEYETIRHTEPAADGFDVLYVGRLTEEKNVGTLIRALHGLTEHPDTRLGVVGEGPHREQLESLVAELGCDDRVTFVGTLPDAADVYAHMRAADVLASASTREGFGIVFAEAMAAGCTVLTADHPRCAAGEVVGDAGFSASPTVSAFTEALDRLLNGARPPLEPTDAARAYDWDRVTEELLEVYRSV